MGAEARSQGREPSLFYTSHRSIGNNGFRQVAVAKSIILY